MNWYDRSALAFSIVIFFTCLWISINIFDAVPHLEDEMAYVWQAKTTARGDLTIDSPPCSNCFLVPFVVDYEGSRFGKYPPGWPALLAIGEKFNIRPFVNPFLAAFSAWLIYRLSKKLMDEKTALIALVLTGTSPFFLMNAGSLLSHIWSLWLALVFMIAWIDLFLPKAENNIPYWIPLIAGSMALGLLTLTRPLTAAGLALPFIFHGIWILIKGNNVQKMSALSFALLSGFLASQVFVWQYILTGDLRLNPYQLWWPYDKLGFGPGIGLQPGGYSWFYAKANAKFSLSVGFADLFGWFRYSWIFVPFGIFFIRKDLRGWLVSLTIPGIIAAYTLYWIGSWLFGPRYYFEALIGAVILSAGGTRFLAGRLNTNTKTKFHTWINRGRFFLTTLLVVFLISSNLFIYLPIRMKMMQDLYDISAEQLLPFQQETTLNLAPALILVHPQNHWREYGGLVELSSPYYDSPFVFTYSRGPKLDEEVIEFLPERSVWHYYPTLPYQLFSSPLPEVQRSD